MFSSTSYAEWTKTGAVLGNNYYLDFSRIRKVDGYVYFWVLADYLKPNNAGSLSVKAYYQGDCKLFRMKIMSASFYKEPMGYGAGRTLSPSKDEWTYPAPNSADETHLKYVCETVK